MKKYLLTIISIFISLYNVRVSASVTELYNVNFKNDITNSTLWKTCNGESDTTCRKEVIDNYWESNNSRIVLSNYYMDGETSKTERYIYWQNKFCSKVINTSDTRCLNDNEYLTINITKDKNGNPLNINTANYQDIRFAFNHLITGVFTDYFKNNQFVLYYYDTNNNKYGPYYIDDYEFNGYKAQNDVVKAAGYKIISQNLKPNTNVIINKIELLPQGNSPVSKTEDFSNDWRNNEDATFYVESMFIYGYQEEAYTRSDVQTKSIDVNETRINAAKSMYDLVTVKWKPEQDMTNMTSSGNNNSTYYADHYYYGPFYSNYSNASLENFKNHLNDDGVLKYKEVNGKQYKYIPGAACSSSVSYSMSKYVNGIDRFQTVDYIFGRNNTYLLGNLEIDGKKGISESVYTDLYNNYMNKININTLNSTEVNKKNNYKNMIDHRIKSNDSKMYYYIITGSDGNFYPNLGYSIKPTQSEEAIPARENFKLKVENLSIVSGKNVNITFKYIINNNTTYDINSSNITEDKLSIKLCNTSNCTVVPSSNITITQTKEIDDDIYLYTVTGSLATTSNVTRVEIEPFESAMLYRVFRLYDVQISASGVNYYSSASTMGTLFNLSNNANDSSIIETSIVNNINGTISTSDFNKMVADFLARQDIYVGYSELTIGDNVSTHSSSNTHAKMVTGSTHISCLDGTVLELDRTKTIPTAVGNCNDHFGIDSHASYNIVTDISLSPISTKYSARNNYGGLINDNDFVAMELWDPNPEYTDLDNDRAHTSGNKIINMDGKNLYGGSEAYNNLNYRINYKIFFADEWKNKSNEYLPVSLNAYKSGKVEKIYTKYINGNTAADIKNGFKGSIYSNYPIISINYYIKNIDTGSEYSNKIYNDHSDTIGLMGSYSLYYHTSGEIKDKLTELISDTSSYEVTVTVDAGTSSNMPILSIKSFTITADANGGTIPAITGWTLNSNGTTASKPIVYDETYGTLPTPTRSGYNFEGWYTAKTGGKEVTPETIVHTTKSYTMYARWTEKTATLTYNANGHGTAPSSVTMKYTEATNAANAITASGYVFNKWNTKADGTGTSYNAGAQVKAVNVEPIDTTLYAIWYTNPVVTFNCNGGSGSMSNQTVVYNTNTALVANACSRAEHSFVGWNTKSDGTGTSYANQGNIKTTSNITLYAKWTGIGDVIFDEQYSTVDDTNNMLRNISVNTKVEDLFNSTINNETLKIYSKTGSLLYSLSNHDSTIVLATGQYVEFENSNGETERYAISVRGDTNGDGRLSFVDYVNVYNHIKKVMHPELTNKTLLVNEYLYAAEMTSNTTININFADYVAIYNKIKNHS